jgi:hypothetical protein
MRLAVALAIAIAFSQTEPAMAATDPTSALLDKLDRCDPALPALAGPPLDLLLALADGRSADELKDALHGPRRCIGYVLAAGRADDEVVLVGAARAGDTVGAVLWVDRGWWRAATAPIGYLPEIFAASRRGLGQELLIGIAGGGSAGNVGIIGLRLSGTIATTILLLPPELTTEIREARILDEDHILVEGRHTSKLFKWNSHSGWPGGAQWLFERRDGSFALVARRQAHDPEYVASGFIGALIARDPMAMRLFASPTAVAEALALPAGRYNGAVGVFLGPDFIQRERISWVALPESMRTVPPTGPAWGPFPVSEERPDSSDILLRFERGDDGWIITDLEAGPAHAAGEARLIP